MSTSEVNGNESSQQPGGNGDIPLNTLRKVVRARVLPMKRSRNNKTDWGICVSFYLQGNNSKKKGQQVVNTSGYATGEAAKADLNAFVNLVELFGHGHKAKWKEYRASRGSSSSTDVISTPPPPVAPPINTDQLVADPKPRKRLLNASQLKQYKRLRQTLPVNQGERRSARLQNLLQESANTAASNLDEDMAKSLLHFRITIRRRLRELYAMLAEVDGAATSTALSIRKGKIRQYLFISADKSRGDKDYELSEVQMVKLTQQLRAVSSVLMQLRTKYTEELLMLLEFKDKYLASRVLDNDDDGGEAEEEEDVTEAVNDAPQDIQAFKDLRMRHLTEYSMPSIAAKVLEFVLLHLYAPSTVLQWYNEFKHNNYKGFAPDRTGQWDRQSERTD